MQKQYERNMGNFKLAISKTNDKSTYPNSIIIDGEHQSDESKIADSFNDFYSKIGNTTSENIPHSDHHFSHYLENPTINSMVLERVDELDVLRVVDKLKAKNSCGHDGIPTRIMKRSIYNILTQQS